MFTHSPTLFVGLGLMKDEELEAVVCGVGDGMIVLEESREAEHKRRERGQADHPPLVIAPKPSTVLETSGRPSGRARVALL